MKLDALDDPKEALGALGSTEEAVLQELVKDDQSSTSETRTSEGGPPEKRPRLAPRRLQAHGTVRAL